jgi:hypothetical protein
MTTTSPAISVPNPAETVRRPTRILAAFMEQQLAQNYAGQTLDPAFMNRWQTYNGRVAALPPTLTSAQVRPLSARGQQHVAPIQANPLFQGTYGPTAQCVMVELGRLIAFQFHVDMDHSAGVHGVHLASVPTEDELLDRCLPPSIVPPVQAFWTTMQKVPGGPAASVTISSTDLTFDIAGGFPLTNQGNGQVMAAVSAGANMMLVRRHGSHLVLANGYHRAFVLRSRGVDFAPVVLVDVQRQEDLVAGGLAYTTVFGSRQPCIDDFLDDTLAMTVDARAMLKVVRMTFESLLVPRIV